jgi:DnaJ family protein A protein 5
MAEIQRMRCHYEVLELENRSVSTDDIKKQYRKLALKWHPDKNVGQQELAVEKFKEINAAYTVLTDRNERQWYDEHREDILRGRDGTSNNNDDNDHTMNLWPFFSTSACSGPDDGPTGFFTIYSKLFEDINSAENDQDLDREEVPPFGDSKTPYSSVTKFYDYYVNFVTKLSFSWEDKYNPSEAPNRDVRRVIEKENKKLRDDERKKYNSQVKALANNIYNRDPRIRAFKMEEQQKKQLENELKQMMKLEEQKRKKELREEQRLRILNDTVEREKREQERKRSYLLAEESSSEEDQDFNDLTEEEAEIILQRRIEDERIAAKNKNYMSSESEEDEQDDYSCSICSKDFKTKTQLTQHTATKNHRKLAADFEKKEKKAKFEAKKLESKAAKDNKNIKTSTATIEVIDKEVVEKISEVEIVSEVITSDPRGKKLSKTKLKKKAASLQQAQEVVVEEIAVKNNKNDKDDNSDNESSDSDLEFMVKQKTIFNMRTINDLSSSDDEDDSDSSSNSSLENKMKSISISQTKKIKKGGKGKIVGKIESIPSDPLGQYKCRECTWCGESRKILCMHLQLTGHKTAFDIDGPLPNSMFLDDYKKNSKKLDKLKKSKKPDVEN